jgi:hypothetical protein
VWEDAFNWLGLSLPIDLDGWNHFLLSGNLVKSKKACRVRHLISLATTQSLSFNEYFSICVLKSSSNKVVRQIVSTWIDYLIIQ